MISISQTAAKEIKRIQLSRQQPDSQLRLTIKSGGCSGLFYVLNLEPNNQHNLEQTSQTDHLYESNGIKIIVNQETFCYVEGLQLDYSEDLMGGGFRFQNPNAISSCGCGLSFTCKRDETIK
ncbi:iron-sulfur cluster assembly accessory protein [Stanieria cyanosphaera PCC 7437]|uniref:Iron-sulfur cluster assembly accessory protein n=1 Tax=Stanieria cyanosphaera (strain ATCC 29371 / PCC 7437) TaxID=111780 RepID=K9XVY5_STAC7|nr:iron-sulfur cluster assembly accessory protein [Stanieria cyanosphaera]AFZ35832.1 iron-sulfur cluster assembly accessory protein [Stanieria cyanosphaera PCC 7437]